MFHSIGCLDSKAGKREKSGTEVPQPIHPSFLIKIPSL